MSSFFSGDKESECGICETEMADKSSLVHHLVGAHRIGQKSLRPENLDSLENETVLTETNKLSTETLAEQVAHSSSSMNADRFECHLCGKLIKAYADFVVHYCMVHFKADFEKQYQNGSSNDCPQCETKFVLQSSLFRHLFSAHGALEGKIPSKEHAMRKVAQPDPMRKFFCQKCSQTCAKYPQLVSHLAIVHFKKELSEEHGLDAQSSVCHFCNLKLAGLNGLLSHIANVHKALKGKIPRKEEFVNGDVEQQIPVFKEQIPVSKFRVAANSIYYKCEICDKTRNAYIGIVSHYGLAHFRQKLVDEFAFDDSKTCSICNVKLAKIETLVRHLVREHGALKDEIPTRDSYLQRNVISGGQVTFKCHICKQSRASYSKLLCHLAIVHFKKLLVERYNIKDDDAICSICDRKFSNTSRLCSHLARVHHALKDEVPAKNDLRLEIAEPDQLVEPDADEPASTVHVLQCHVCKKVKSSFTKMLYHYGYVHYREKLVTFFFSFKNFDFLRRQKLSYIWVYTL
jgi:hypothetical protein